MVDQDKFQISCVFFPSLFSLTSCHLSFLGQVEVRGRRVGEEGMKTERNPTGNLIRRKCVKDKRKGRLNFHVSTETGQLWDYLALVLLLLLLNQHRDGNDQVAVDWAYCQERWTSSLHLLVSNRVWSSSFYCLFWFPTAERNNPLAESVPNGKFNFNNRRCWSMTMTRRSVSELDEKIQLRLLM